MSDNEAGTSIETRRRRVARIWTGERVRHRLTGEVGFVLGSAQNSAATDVRVRWSSSGTGIAHVKDLELASED